MVLAIVAGSVAVAAAIRSTWSPCGLSMLSTITPVGERGRRNSYRTTAVWFVAGSVLGGALLGGACALLALAYRALGASHMGTLVVGAALALLCATSDSAVTSFRLPFHRRQVNEQWLDEFRSWVYGFGFGLQIGCGLATFITSAAVYLTIALAVLSADPATALACGTAFGLVRGLSVLLTKDVTDTAGLIGLHRRVALADPLSRRMLVAVQLLACSALLALAWWPAAVVAAVLVAGGAMVALSGRNGSATEVASASPAPQA
jgi:MFS family permease